MTKSMKDEIEVLKAENLSLLGRNERLQTKLDRKDAQMDIISIILDKARNVE